jgi:pilus assembly protein TadC
MNRDSITIEEIVIALRQLVEMLKSGGSRIESLRIVAASDSIHGLRLLS